MNICSFSHSLSVSTEFPNYADTYKVYGLPWWLSSKESACNADNVGLILGLGRSPGEGNGNPFQYSCLKNTIDRGAWRSPSGLHRVGHNLVINNNQNSTSLENDEQIDQKRKETRNRPTQI